MDNFAKMKTKYTLNEREIQMLDKKVYSAFDKKSSAFSNSLGLVFKLMFSMSVTTFLIIGILYLLNLKPSDNGIVKNVSAQEVLNTSLNAFYSLKGEFNLAKLSMVITATSPQSSFTKISTEEWIDMENNSTRRKEVVNEPNKTFTQQDGSVVTMSGNTQDYVSIYNADGLFVNYMIYPNSQSSYEKVRQPIHFYQVTNKKLDLSRIDVLSRYLEIISENKNLTLTEDDQNYYLKFEYEEYRRAVTVNNVDTSEIKIPYLYELTINKQNKMPIQEVITSQNPEYEDKLVIDYAFEFSNMEVKDRIILFTPSSAERKNDSIEYEVIDESTDLTGVLSIDNVGEQYFKAYLRVKDGESYILESELYSTTFGYIELPTMISRINVGKEITINGEIRQYNAVYQEKVVAVKESIQYY